MGQGHDQVRGRPHNVPVLRRDGHRSLHVCGLPKLRPHRARLRLRRDGRVHRLVLLLLPEPHALRVQDAGRGVQDRAGLPGHRAGRADHGPGNGGVVDHLCCRGVRPGRHVQRQGLQHLPAFHGVVCNRDDVLLGRPGVPRHRGVHHGWHGRRVVVLPQVAPPPDVVGLRACGDGQPRLDLLRSLLCLLGANHGHDAGLHKKKRSKRSAARRARSWAACSAAAWRAPAAWPRWPNG